MLLVYASFTISKAETLLQQFMMLIVCDESQRFGVLTHQRVSHIDVATFATALVGTDHNGGSPMTKSRTALHVVRFLV